MSRTVVVRKEEREPIMKILIEASETNDQQEKNVQTRPLEAVCSGLLFMKDTSGSEDYGREVVQLRYCAPGTP